MWCCGACVGLRGSAWIQWQHGHYWIVRYNRQLNIMIYILILVVDKQYSSHGGRWIFQEENAPNGGKRIFSDEKIYKFEFSCVLDARST